LDQPFVGQIALFPYTFAPKNWARCQGQILEITTFEALFSLIGTYFGGDGQRTFALPNLPDPAPDIHYYIAMYGIFPSRP
jgi:microcystin-dependent protein